MKRKIAQVSVLLFVLSSAALALPLEQSLRQARLMISPAAAGPCDNFNGCFGSWLDHPTKGFSFACTNQSCLLNCEKPTLNGFQYCLCPFSGQLMGCIAGWAGNKKLPPVCNPFNFAYVCNPPAKCGPVGFEGVVCCECFSGI